MSGIGHRVRELREAEGLTVRVLSDRTGLAENSISRIERGERVPSATSVEAIARGLGVAPGVLFEKNGVSHHDKINMGMLVSVLTVSRTPDERIWLARQIERTAIEDGYLRPEYRQHPKLVNPPRWRGGEM